ncbi:MAG TPA: polysaccharide biosynthesis/export family protein [Pyrinomonadaceae bacterium]
MKKLIIAGVIAISSLSTSAFAQVKSSPAANNHTNAARSTSAGETARARETPKPTPMPQTVAVNREQPADQARGNAQATNISGRPRIAAATAPKAVATPVNNSAAPTSVSAPTTTTAPTQLYRVGVGDILDIQIPDSMSDRSTLYTVMEGGLLDYPLAGDPMAVDGLTTDAIAQKLRGSIKVLDNPEIKVKVRDYASHTAKVIGFVSIPGDKVLRREAVPLYVVLSEAMPLSDAVSVTIVRNGKDLPAVNLADAEGTSQVVLDGDVIKVSGQSVETAEYFYAGGEVNAPGQKAFHNGITLTQAIIVSGGAAHNAGATVRVSRQGADGRLSAIEYNLRNIQAGKVPDPQIQKNDRIEVSRNEQR